MISIPSLASSSAPTLHLYLNHNIMQFYPTLLRVESVEGNNCYNITNNNTKYRMIGQYDQIQEKVKLHQAVMKGKLKSVENLSSLGMNVILQKNKKINLSKKQLQDKVIKARRLKIKINQIYGNHFASQFYQNQPSSTSQLHIKTQRKHSNTNKNNHLQVQNASKRLFQSAENNKKNKSLLNSKRESMDDNEGNMNIFDNFSDEQLNQIEQDESYYLKGEEMINIFRRYMVRKRINSKDYSYQKFTIKNTHDQFHPFSQRKILDKRSYILNTLGIPNNTVSNKSTLHLLTNPIDFSSTMPDIRSKSLPLRNSKKQLFTIFKDKQIMNKDRIIQEHRKRILDLKIDRNYYDGMASEKRAVHHQNMQKFINNKNKEDTERSMLYRQRNKTVFDQIGKTVELAQAIRGQMMKRREKKKKI